MKLLVVYSVLVALGEALAVGVGEIVELTYPSASLLSFLAMFFAMLGVAWIAALRLTGD